MREVRSETQLRRHYDVEKALADKLRGACSSERGRLYSEVYEDLFRMVEDHPQLSGKNDPDRSYRKICTAMQIVRKYLDDNCVFLEIGAGDCAVSKAIAAVVRQVYALDVSDTITSGNPLPENCRLILTAGCEIDLPEDSVDVAYSDQVMEHIHPEDAIGQLREVYRVLRPGGKYVCITPNRLSGPHDISRTFDEIATGLHLKEYSIGELSALFRQAGFRSVRVFKNVKHAEALPPAPFICLEKVLELLPRAVRKGVARNQWVEHLINPVLVCGK